MHTKVATGEVLIRPATADDVPAALELVKEFHDEVINDFGFGFSPMVAVNFAFTQVQGCFVAELEGQIIGLIAGSVIVYPISGQRAYVESIWYVKKEQRRHGLKLLRRLEEWCVEQKIPNIIMALMCSDKATKLGKFYEACGYRPFEMQYVKNL